MKIVLLRLPSYDMLCPPLNLVYLHACLNARNFDVTTLDLNAEAFHATSSEIREKYWKLDSHALWNSEDTFSGAVSGRQFREWKKKIAAFKPDVVGFSLYNANLAPSLKLAAELKTDAVKIVFGGPYCRRENDTALSLMEQHSFVDAVVVGEGEETLAELAGNYRARNVQPCRGALVRIKERIIDGGERPLIADIDRLPFPDLSGFDLSLYPDATVPCCPAGGVFTGARSATIAFSGENTGAGALKTYLKR